LRARSEVLAGRALLAAVLLASISLLLVRLGDESLLGDEAIYASVARDSARAGRWFPLVYDGEPYTSKPPLAIWAQRLALATGARPEWAVRLPGVLAGWLAIALFGLWTARRATPLAGALAAALLASGHLLLFRHGLRHGGMEGPLLLATVVTVAALYEWSRRPRPAAVALAALACAFGAGAKGIVAPAFALSILGAFALLARADLPRGFARSLAGCVGAGVAVWALWLAALAVSGVERLGGIVRRDLVERATTGIDVEHLAGPAFYPQILGRELGGWLLLAPLALLPLAAAPGRDDAARLRRLALAWSLAPALLLSLSASKLPWYLYPALPGWALLVALGFDRLGATLGRFRAAGALALLLAVAALGVRFEARWRRASAERPERVTLRALADDLAGDRERILVFDRVEDPALGPLREWHWFYLGQVADRVDGLDAPRPAGRCPIVVTPRPAVAIDRLAMGELPTAPVYRVTATERPLWVVDGCGGATVARLAALKAPPAPGSSG
jgi:4-amino-4-deoxy-L-arabinose transferase-like glycosyltransferase